MALDTKQKRGSAIGILLPWRQWLGEPGESAGSLRLSLVRLCSATFDDGGPPVVATRGTGPEWEVGAQRMHWELPATRLQWEVPEQ